MISRKLLRTAFMLEESGKQSKILRIALINVTYPPSNRMDSMLFIQIALNNPAADECSGFMIAKEALAVLSSSCFDRLQRTMPYNMGMPYMPNTNGKTFL